jgi:hypothetical protein
MQAEAQGIRTMFARMAAEPVDAVQVAQIAGSIWNDVSAALAPIIGQPGVIALLKRSVYLTRGAHSCLSTLFGDDSPSDPLDALQSLLARQAVADAVVINAVLLLNFQNLLDTLIGASLTERLLRPVWDTPSSGQAVQDNRS